ncbi:hypothetical protein EPUL_005747, partial [Erysiphe pulchra]
MAQPIDGKLSEELGEITLSIGNINLKSANDLTLNSKKITLNIEKKKEYIRDEGTLKFSLLQGLEDDEQALFDEYESLWHYGNTLYQNTKSSDIYQVEKSGQISFESDKLTNKIGRKETGREETGGEKDGSINDRKDDKFKKRKIIEIQSEKTKDTIHEAYKTKRIRKFSPTHKISQNDTIKLENEDFTLPEP